ncbi:tetratricopeptide repeat protein [Gammaproteobacteria bacterium]|nr:tetratricopeptide repeat protein [Gammaproteobacteria bacterium]MDB4059714.1 tetratricopeptide repeat protein [Gammaproteobacteria bacterium]MDC1491402.1 tetratricopeptide repeat protein [Gammaproteobacteria bacterium]|tara:strand:- start:574 stop:1794 length:1221 start_codon:yes stop_codon:yes gene_type:complete
MKHLFILLLFSASFINAAPSNNENTISGWVYYDFLSIEDKLAQGRYAEVDADYLELINDNSWSSRSFDHAVILKKYGFFLVSMDRVPEGLKHLQWSLRKKALEPRDAHNVKYVVAQISASLGEYEKALDYLLDWYDVGVNRNFDLTPKGIALIGICYAQLEEYRPAIKYITMATERSYVFMEPWYELKFALHYRLEEFLLALETSQDLVRHAPKEKKYLEQMGAMYNQLKFEIESLSSLEFAFTQDLLKTEKDYLLLSNFYMYKAVPNDAVKVLTAGFKRKIIKTNSKNLETMSNAFLASRENLKAADKLREASELSDDPELSFRLGQIELNLSRWDKAIESFKLAQKKGWDEEEGKIEYFIGISFIELEKFNDAVKYLSLSSELGQEKLVEPWLQYIDYLQKTAS